MSWPPTAPGTEAKPAPGFVASTADVVVAAEIRPIIQPAEAARMASAALRIRFLPEGGGTLAQVGHCHRPPLCSDRYKTPPTRSASALLRRFDLPSLGEVGSSNAWANFGRLPRGARASM